MTILKAKNQIRVLALMLLTALCGATTLAGAGDFGNRFTMLGQGKFAVGAEVGYMDELPQKDSHVNVTQYYRGNIYKGSVPAADLKTTGDLSGMVTLGYGIVDQLNVYAKLGMADGGKLKMSIFNYMGRADLDADLNSVFTWAVGAKARIFETESGLGMLLGAQYTRYDDREIDSWRSNGGPTGSTGTDDTLKFWQINAAAAIYYKLGVLTPYAGALYSYSRTEMNGDWTYRDGTREVIDMTSENKDNFGALVGLQWDIGQHFSANAQGTFFTSTTVSLGLSYCF